MNEDNINIREKSEELKRIEIFIDDGKYDKTLEIMKKFEELRESNQNDVV